MKNRVSMPLELGSIAGTPVYVSQTALQQSIRHADAIAGLLGLTDVETSLASYWSLRICLQQWNYLLAWLGVDYARRLQFVEVGSGMGLFTLTGTLLGYNVMGLDKSSNQYQASLHIAQQIFNDNNLEPRVLQAAAEALPLQTGTVDVVVSFETIEHAEDIETMLQEVHRILKPGGFFFARFPNYQSFYEAHYGVLSPLVGGKRLIGMYLRRLGRPTNFLEHLQWVTPARIRQSLRTCGFVDAVVQRAEAMSVSQLVQHTHVSSLPFRFKRGILAYKLAYVLAKLLDLMGISDDFYPHIELWAQA